MNVHPFQFDLPKLSERERMLHEALFAFLPKTGLRHKAFTALGEGLEKQIGIPVPFTLEAVAERSFEEFQRKLSEPAFVCVIGLPPTQTKLFLDVDMETALLIIDCMLGGEASETADLRRPSEIEQGVFQYLLLQLFAHLHQAAGGHPRINFRFEKFLFSAEGLKTYEDPAEPLTILTFRLRLGAADGFVRLAFPLRFIEEAFLDAQSPGTLSSDERAFALQTLQHYHDFRFALWAEAGRTTLMQSEVEALETGDVIILEHAELILQDDQPAGKVLLKVGYGNEQGFIADLSLSPRKAHCRVVDMLVIPAALPAGRQEAGIP